MLYYTFLITCSILVLHSSSAIENKPDTAAKTKCVNDFVKWCKGMKYDKDTVNTLSDSYHSNSEEYRVVCVMDGTGTDCTMDKKPWFNCSPKGTVTYEKVQLREGSVTGVSDDICNAKDAAFNRIGVDNMGMDKKAFEMSMGKLKGEMQHFSKEMSVFGQRLGGMFPKIFGR